MPFFRKPFKPRYVRSAKKPRYLRKRQAANLAHSRSLYAKYSAPRTLSQTTEYPIRRMYSPSAIAAGSAWADALYSFRISDLPDASELTALYDQYRVDKLVVHFINGTQPPYVSHQDVGTLLTAVDFDGGATGLTFSQFLSYESCEVTPHGKVKTITIKPRAEVNSTDSGGNVVSASLAAANTWWDVSNTNVQHHGIRYGMTPYSAGSSGDAAWYTLWIEAYVTFKNTR